MRRKWRLTKTNEDMKVDDELSLYLLKQLLPYLKQLSQEEMTEIEIEASNQGIFSLYGSMLFRE
jgi:hypothetical protein